MGEYDCLTQHILGLENVKKNISDKMKELHFSDAQAKIIMDDIFVRLYNYKTSDYNERFNYIFKDELRKKLGAVKTASITDTVQVLKKRSTHLYSNACKAIYNHGLYKLSTPFEDLQMNYNEWFSLIRERKEQHLKRVFSHVPSENDVAGEGIDAKTNEHLEDILGASLTRSLNLRISFF